MFVGYGIGMLMFFIPDLLGRKPSMLIMLFFNIIGGYLSVFCVDINLKKMGFFLIGMFHLKVALSYIYISEVVESKHNLLASTIISAYDVTTLVVISFALKWTGDLNIVFEYAHYVGVAASMVFLVLMKESPKHLLISNTRNSQQALQIFDYIARFNGSSFRLPRDAYFNFLGQALEDESQVVHNQNDSYLKQNNRSLLHQSIRYHVDTSIH